MGSLAAFGVGGLRERFHLKVLVETGTGLGDGIVAGLEAGFELIHSIEIDEGLFQRARRRFVGEQRVRLHCGHSIDQLPQILRTFREPALFWLDGHYPGADHVHGDYTAEANPSRRLPLQDECRLLADAADARSVILVDDVRIYTGQDWHYEQCVSAPWDLRKPLGSLNLSHFASTHVATAFWWMEGYLLLEPRLGEQGSGDSIPFGPRS